MYFVVNYKRPLEKEMQPTPVFLLGNPHGQRRLEAYSPWGCKELVEWGFFHKARDNSSLEKV